MQRKGSIISAIFSSYREALKLSQERYSQLYSERAVNAIEFYDTFLKDLIIKFDEFEQAALRRQIRGTVEAFFGKDDIQFVAIDGTCKKDPFTDFMVFSSIAYGVRGEISLQGDPPTLKYKRRSMDEDVSGVGIATQRTRYLDTSIMAQSHTYMVSKLPQKSDREKVVKLLVSLRICFDKRLSLGPAIGY